MRRALPFVVCFAIGVAIAFVWPREEPEPRDEWAERYAEVRAGDPRGRWPDLVRRQLPGMSIAVPAAAVLAPSSEQRAGQLAVGDIHDLVKPTGSGVIVWWREGELTARLPLAGDPVASVVEWSRDMGDARVRAGVPDELEPLGSYGIELRSRAHRAYARYLACSQRVVGARRSHRAELSLRVTSGRVAACSKYASRPTPIAMTFSRSSAR